MNLGPHHLQEVQTHSNTLCEEEKPGTVLSFLKSFKV